MEKADAQNDLIRSYEKFASQDVAGALLPDDGVSPSTELPRMVTAESMIADPNKVICPEVMCSSEFFVMLHFVLIMNIKITKPVVAREAHEGGFI